MRISYLICLTVLAVILTIAVATEVGNPTLTKTELLSIFWPRYCLIIVLFGLAIGVLISATEIDRG